MLFPVGSGLAAAAFRKQSIIQSMLAGWLSCGPRCCYNDQTVLLFLFPATIMKIAITMSAAPPIVNT